MNCPTVTIQALLLRSLRVVLLTTVSLLAIASVVRAKVLVHLDVDTLSKSRGGNQNKMYYRADCDKQNGNFPCLPGVTGLCVGCQRATFLSLTTVAGTGGFYFSPLTSNVCGLNMLGTCTGISSLCQNLAGAVGRCPSNWIIKLQP